MPGSRDIAPQRQPPPTAVRLRQRTAIVSRWLHLYLSMVSFAVILFFAVTGFTLNHADWFDAQQKTVQRHGSVPLAWLPPAKADADRLQIVEHLRSADKVHGAVSDFRVDDNQVAVSFKAPGYTADTFIDSRTGQYDVTITSSGLVAVLNDLHRGQNSGKAWGWLIDASAVLLSLVSLTGLLLLLFVYKRRLSGLLLAAAGAVVCWLLWLHFVP